MMRVPTYTREVTPSGQPAQAFSLPGEKRQPLSVPMAKENALRAAASFAENLTGIGKRMAEAQIQDQYATGYTQASTAFTGLLDRYKSPEFQEATDPDDYEQVFTQDVATVRDAAFAGVKSRQARDQLSRAFTTLETEARSRVTTLARHRQVDRMKANYHHTVRTTVEDALKNALAGDMSAVQNGVVTLEAMVAGYVASGVISADQGRADLERVQDELPRAIYERAIVRDPEGTYADLQGGRPETLSEPAYTALLSKAKTAAKTARIEREQEAKERERTAQRAIAAREAVISERLDDIFSTMLRTGQEVPGTLELIGNLQGLGKGEKAEDFLTRYELVKKAWAVRNEHKWKPFDLQRRAVDALTPAPGEEGYALKYEVRDQAMRAVTQDEQRFQADPAAYVAQEAYRLAQAAGIDPERDVPGFLDISAGLQAAMGAVSPSVLSEDAKDRIKGDYMVAAPEKKVEIIRGIKQTYGKYALHALRDLGLSAAHTFAADLPDKAAIRLLKAMDVKEDSDFGLHPDTKRKITKEVASYFYESGRPGWILQELARRTGNPEYLHMADSLENATCRVAWTEGNAETAMKLLWGHFQFLAEEDLVIGWTHKGIQKDWLMDALRERRDLVAEDAAWKEKTFESPWQYQEYVSDIRERGVWVPAKNGEGFVLTDSKTGMAVTRQDGSPIRFMLEELGDYIIKKEARATVYPKEQPGPPEFIESGLEGHPFQWME